MVAEQEPGDTDQKGNAVAEEAHGGETEAELVDKSGPMENERNRTF